MKNLHDYIDEAKKLGACSNGIEYTKQFNTLEEFVNSEQRSYINWFFYFCDVEDKVYYLLKDKKFGFQIASTNGHTEFVKLLLDDPRVDPSDYDNGAIRWASENGHIEVVRLLLADERVDPSADNNNLAIRCASENGHIEVVNLLKKYI